jgi:hypothetical protein
MPPTAKFLLTTKSPGAQSFSAYGENILTLMRIPVHRGQSFRRIADSIPVIADSF